jgi:sortase (surface protein transpeptidase)
VNKVAVRPDEDTWAEAETSSRGPLTARHVIVVLACIASLAAIFLAHRTVLSTLIHDQRQRHLAAEFKTPSASIEENDPVAIVQIATLAVNEMVVEGSSVRNLRSGPTHRSGSRLPGEAGTMVLDGHRNMYGAPFKKVGELQKGDVVAVQARSHRPLYRRRGSPRR